MSSYRIEAVASIVIASLVALALILAARFFSGMANDHGEMLGYLERQESRLEALESNKAKATAKRWTADDQMEYIACMEFANFSPERQTCLNRIKARFQTTQQ